MSTWPSFVGDFSTGDFSQWESVQSVVGRATVVTTPAKAGTPYVARFEVQPGDVEPITGSNRCELAAQNSTLAAYFTEGDERYFGWATYLSPSFPVQPFPPNTNMGHVLMQLKQSGAGSPPLWLQADGEKLALNRGTTPVANYYVGPLVRSEWIAWVLRVKFSSDPAVGFVELWRNGGKCEMVTGSDRAYGATLQAATDSYWKLGCYRDPAHTATAIVYHAAARWGASYPEVAPIVQGGSPAPSPRKVRAARPGRTVRLLP